MDMYLSIEDLKKGIRGEVLQVIMRDEDNGIQAIAEAMAEVESYLSARYDIVLELAKTHSDSSRNFMVVKLVRDIALYNCHNIAAPVSFPENRMKSYENAVKFLQNCQAEKASIPGLQRLRTSEDGTVSSNYVSFSGSSPKRNHHF
jgi:phage gp36-like protein